MSKIILTTQIQAPVQRCFDLARSVDAHIDSAAHTKERAIAGVTSGLMNLNDEVTWEAIHFGIRQNLKVKITKMNAPTYFRDSQVDGIFKRMDHDHYFETYKDGTIMRDEFDFECPYGVFGMMAQPVVHSYLKAFLKNRNAILKKLAEG